MFSFKSKIKLESLNNKILIYHYQQRKTIEKQLYQELIMQYLLLTLLLITTCFAIPFINLNKNSQTTTNKHHPKISPNQKHFIDQEIFIIEPLSIRILQDNPFSPTGDIMTTTPGVTPNNDVLSIDIINQIVQQNGTSTKPNDNNNTANPLYTIGNNASSLNISLGGQSNYNYTNQDSMLGGQAWTQTSVDEKANDPYWISASNLLYKLNVSYFYPNQIIILKIQNNPIGVAFNITYRSVRGFIQSIILVNQSYISTLISNNIKTNISAASVNQNTALYNVTRSLLQSLFYDFTLNPLTLQNGTETNISDFTLYDLRYQSKNGVYDFLIKSKINPGGLITGELLACNPRTINVTTQTVPVLASLNIVNVDYNFKFINATILKFLSQNLRAANASITYNSVVLWSNRAGSSIFYLLNISISRQLTSNSVQSYVVGVNYNITNRYQTISYWRNSEPIIQPYSNTSVEYQEVPYLSVVGEPTFMNVDLSARLNYPSMVVGPLVKVQRKRVAQNKSGYRLTYFGVNGQNVQADYTP